ncbi:lipid A export permease/ATP-binding protein MsbA [Alkalisalibacterium limincola]|uniref:Lipid A export permease/ATP-binding protein MsbA n=1 Tax=Alkalisalibacterium limincola TaxID=2699169 RepID=A0A5C8KX40_9GAMM|nr:lipid A export permease/ATP-binding protein MsbA [Alkalisalibacterium limincola]TXK65618.1 lipid A export permease/ATP-binding protein MsbA [Alkalisalibacterium limincola]
MSTPDPDGWDIRHTYGRLLRYAGRYKALLAISGVGMIIEAAAAAGFTKLMEPMVNQTFVAQEVSLMLPLAIVGLFLVRGIATFVKNVGMSRAGRSVVRDLRQEVMSKYLRIPSDYFDRESVPSMVSRLNYDTEQVAQASSDAIKITITDSLTLVFLFAVMLSISVRVTMTMVVVAPLIAVISLYVSRRYRKINRGIQDGVAQMATEAEQALASHQDLKIYAGQASESARYAERTNHNLRLHLKVEVTRAAASSTVQLLAAIALAVILIAAGRESLAGRMDAGQFVALITAMMAMLPSLKRITTVQAMIQKGIAAAQRLFQILDSEEEDDAGERPLARARGHVRFRDVVVRYQNGERAAVDGISFEARPGTVTALVGRSGSGKSTLVKLLPRFYEPSSGLIELDGHPLGDYKLADLRRQIALVGQKVMLFDDTVAANIAFGAEGQASDEEIREAARQANALEFIERLPEGMQTRIGENGALLSGGQRQRLAIARAFLKDAPILILDEATAALDSESERLVQAALEKLIPDRTTLVIAHRLSTVEHADQVLVLDDGKLLESGTHAELLAQAGLYSHLHQMQFREVPAT